MPAPTITYRTAGPWGAGKGADLDASEIDNNFFSVFQSIESLIANPPTPNNISSIEVVNEDQLVITLDDYTTFGPFNLPVASFQDRGEWTPTTNYVYTDIFTYLNSLYLVLQPHTSSASFNPNDGNMQGPYYRLLFSAADLMLEWRDQWQPLTAYGTFDLFSVPDVGVFFTLVAHTSAAVFDPLAIDDSGNQLYQKVFAAIESEIARIQAQFPSTQPSDGSVMMSYIQDDDRDLMFDPDLTGCFAHLEVAVTDTLEYTIQYNDETLIVVTFEPGDQLDGSGGQFGTFDAQFDEEDEIKIHNGELLRLVSPTHADATARFLSIAIKGTYVAVAS